MPLGKKDMYVCKAGFQGKCMTRNAVHEIQCTLCHNGTYIGETKRQVRLRFDERLRDAKNKTADTPFGDHMRQHHPDAYLPDPSSRIRILRRCKNVACLKITESEYIRDLHPRLSTQTSAWKLIALTAPTKVLGVY